VVGAPVKFQITSGIATLGTTSAVTDANGQARTTVTAGAIPGPVVITATSGTFSQTFNLVVRPVGPTCDPNNSFVNGASFQNVISPGAIATIYCEGLAPGIQNSVFPPPFGPLPTQLAGVTVKFGEVFAPIYNVSHIGSDESVTVQVPFELAPGFVPVTIDVSGGATTVNAHISSVGPGIFETLVPDGIRRAVLVRPDGSFVSPTNPAHKGERIRAYVTGLIAPAGEIGTNEFSPLDHDVEITTPVVVGVNNAGVHVERVIYARNLIGVWQVEFDVPDNTASGINAPFAVAVPVGKSLVYSQGSKISIQ
jgi:uncharacterized protein (TIGR03437 family)